MGKRNVRRISKALADKLSDYDDGSVYSVGYIRDLIRTDLRDHSHQETLSHQYASNMLSRREFLKILGFVTASGAVSLVAYDRILDGETITGLASSGSCNYTTITPTSSNPKKITLGSGDSFTNTLLDITGDGAEAQIVASGSNWEVRNVGFKGVKELGSNNSSNGMYNCIKPKGNGTIDHVYMGDGTVNGVRAGAIGLPSSHSGDVKITSCYVAKWVDNGLYNANAATNGGGTVHVSNCYFHDNNVASFRIAANGSVIEDCVCHNTGKTRSLPGGGVDATGVYTGYGDNSQTVTVRRCHFDCRQDNNSSEDFWSPASGDSDCGLPAGTGACSSMEVYDTEYAGNIIGNVTLVSGNTKTANPDLTPPSSVPMTSEDAACGTRSGGTTSSSTSTSTSSNTSSSSPC